MFTKVLLTQTPFELEIYKVLSQIQSELQSEKLQIKQFIERIIESHHRQYLLDELESEYYNLSGSRHSKRDSSGIYTEHLKFFIENIIDCNSRENIKAFYLDELLESRPVRLDSFDVYGIDMPSNPMYTRQEDLVERPSQTSVSSSKDPSSCVNALSEVLSKSELEEDLKAILTLKNKLLTLQFHSESIISSIKSTIDKERLESLCSEFNESCLMFKAHKSRIELNKRALKWKLNRLFTEVFTSYECHLSDLSQIPLIYLKLDTLHHSSIQSHLKHITAQFEKLTFIQKSKCETIRLMKDLIASLCSKLRKHYEDPPKGLPESQITVKSNDSGGIPTDAPNEIQLELETLRNYMGLFTEESDVIQFLGKFIVKVYSKILDDLPTGGSKRKTSQNSLNTKNYAQVFEFLISIEAAKGVKMGEYRALLKNESAGLAAQLKDHKANCGRFTSAVKDFYDCVSNLLTNRKKPNLSAVGKLKDEAFQVIETSNASSLLDHGFLLTSIKSLLDRSSLRIDTSNTLTYASTVKDNNLFFIEFFLKCLNTSGNLSKLMANDSLMTESSRIRRVYSSHLESLNYLSILDHESLDSKGYLHRNVRALLQRLFTQENWFPFDFTLGISYPLEFPNLNFLSNLISKQKPNETASLGSGKPDGLFDRELVQSLNREYIGSFVKDINLYHKKRLKEFKEQKVLTPSEIFSKGLFVNDMQIGNTPPGFAFKYLFDNSTICDELNKEKSFILSLLDLRQDYKIQYNESPTSFKPPNWFKYSSESLLDVIANPSLLQDKQSLEKFQSRVVEEYKLDSAPGDSYLEFTLKYTHPIVKKKLMGPSKLDFSETYRVFFVSPLMLVVEITNYISGFMFMDTFYSVVQYEFAVDEVLFTQDGLVEFPLRLSARFGLVFVKDSWLKGTIETDGLAENEDFLRNFSTVHISNVLRSKSRSWLRDYRGVFVVGTEADLGGDGSEDQGDLAVSKDFKRKNITEVDVLGELSWKARLKILPVELTSILLLLSLIVLSLIPKLTQ